MPNAVVARLLCLALGAVCAGCSSSTSPTAVPEPPVGPCTFTITIGDFPIPTHPPALGMPWAAYFAATTVPAQATAYLVDVNAAPAGCVTAWTAVSADPNAVQLSPHGGSGRGQVELFMPQNTGAATRSTAVTIAGQTVAIAQAGR